MLRSQTARWPCAKAPKHNYADICPQGFPEKYFMSTECRELQCLGWTLQFGKLCTAPTSYDGCFAKAIFMNILLQCQDRASSQHTWSTWQRPTKKCLKRHVALSGQRWVLSARPIIPHHARQQFCHGRQCHIHSV